MARNFNKAKGFNKIDEAAKKSYEKGDIPSIRMINSENLVDYPKNQEDIQDTQDIETSIKELGFTDPIEVTNFEMTEGKYMIVSGHRRRAAGVKVGLDMFPCIVKYFFNKDDLHNYVLLSNNQRDSSKEPLLFCKRYKMHEQYLIEKGFKGSLRTEVANRLGISVQQADRYNQFNKVINKAWKLIYDDVVGMSSLLPMASHSPEEQEEILSLIYAFIEDDRQVNRETCSSIVKAYRDGNKIFSDVLNYIGRKDNVVLKDSGIPLNAFISDESREHDPSDKSSRNDEIRREYDPTAVDIGDKARDPYADERLTADDYDVINHVVGADETINRNNDVQKNDIKGNDKELQRGLAIIKYTEKLAMCFNDDYTFSDKGIAEEAMRKLANIIPTTVEVIYDIGQNFKLDKFAHKCIEDIYSEIENYKSLN